MDVKQTSPPHPSQYLTSPPLRKCNWDIFGIFGITLTVMIFRVRNQTHVLIRLTQRVICCIKIKNFKSSSFGKRSNHILSLFKTLLKYNTNFLGYWLIHLYFFLILIFCISFQRLTFESQSGRTKGGLKGGVVEESRKGRKREVLRPNSQALPETSDHLHFIRAGVPVYLPS